jgi:hypothetical protein
MILLYNSSLPLPSNFLQSTYINISIYLFYTYQFLSPVHSLLQLSTMYVHSELLSLSQSFPLPSSIPLSLFRGHKLGFLKLSFLESQKVGLSPNPKLGGPVHHIYSLRTGWPSYTPRHGKPFWSPFTTFKGGSGTVLLPDHQEGFLIK